MSALARLVPRRMAWWRYDVRWWLGELRWRLARDPVRLVARADAELAAGTPGWLFILGVNNSGTSLLWEILRTHPAIRALPLEGQFLTAALPRAREHGVARLWTQRADLFRLTEVDDSAPAARARYDWARFFPRRAGWLLEKSPPHTLRARWLQQWFPASRFVAITRSPYAVCEGIRRIEGCSIEAAAEHWTRAHEILLEDADKLDHFVLLRYEDLCDDPDAELDKVEQLLGLDTPIDRSVLDGPIRVRRNVEGREIRLTNMNAQSLERLSEGDRQTIGRIAGPLMQHLGYPPL
jgi:GNAT superfamily N-acetyltransferase